MHHASAPRNAPRSAPCRRARCASSRPSIRSSAGSRRRASAAARASSRPRAATRPWSLTRQACASSSSPRRGMHMCMCMRVCIHVTCMHTRLCTCTCVHADAHPHCARALRVRIIAHSHSIARVWRRSRRWPIGQTTLPSTRSAGRCASVPTTACGAQACPAGMRAVPSGRASRRIRFGSLVRRCVRCARSNPCLRMHTCTVIILAHACLCPARSGRWGRCCHCGGTPTARAGWTRATACAPT